MHSRDSRNGRLATRLLQFALAGLVLLFLVPLTTLTARAGSVNVYDQANVLKVNTVSQEAAKLPVDIDIYTLNTFIGDAGQLATYATQHFTTQASGMLVVMIDTVNRHIAIEGNGKASFQHQQYVDAKSAFAGNIKNGSGQDDYTAATIAALKSFEQAASSNAVGTVIKIVVVLLIIAVFVGLCMAFGGNSSPSTRRTDIFVENTSTTSSSPSDGTAGSF